MLTNYSYDTQTRNPLKPHFASQLRNAAPARRSAVLSREELRRLVLDMVD